MCVPRNLRFSRRYFQSMHKNSAHIPFCIWKPKHHVFFGFCLYFAVLYWTPCAVFSFHRSSSRHPFFPTPVAIWMRHFPAYIYCNWTCLLKLCNEQYNRVSLSSLSVSPSLTLIYYYGVGAPVIIRSTVDKLIWNHCIQMWNGGIAIKLALSSK